MFLVSVPAPFQSSTVSDAARGHPLRSTVALCSIKRHKSTAEVWHQLHALRRPIHQVSLLRSCLPSLRDVPACHWVLGGRHPWRCQVQRVNWISWEGCWQGNSVGCCWGYWSPLSSLFAAARIPGAMLKNSVCCEIVQDAIVNSWKWSRGIIGKF